MNFTEELIKETIANLANDYNDNYDHYRFGPPKARAKKKSTLKQAAVEWLNKKGYYNISEYNKTALASLDKQLVENRTGIENCEKLFYMLENDSSKKLLIKLLCFKILGRTKVKLPLSKREYWDKIKEIENAQIKSDHVKAPGVSLNYDLYKTPLHKFGYPIAFYYSAIGLMTNFIVKQYEYHADDVVIKAKGGDYVIDAGGCWGDTALFFATEVSPNGMVYSFEFIPSNIALFYKNVDMNPESSRIIELVKQPLWDSPGKQIFYFDNGPGSKISFEKEPKLEGETTTISIDNWFTEQKIKKVDFIKMDIEGAEMNALYGGIETIKRFKPKLAICIYHQWEDFYQIPAWIKNLNLGYKFYLSHSTIYSEETVLFATT